MPLSVFAGPGRVEPWIASTCEKCCLANGRLPPKDRRPKVVQVLKRQSPTFWNQNTSIRSTNATTPATAAGTATTVDADNLVTLVVQDGKHWTYVSLSKSCQQDLIEESKVTDVLLGMFCKPGALLALKEWKYEIWRPQRPTNHDGTQDQGVSRGGTNAVSTSQPAAGACIETPIPATSATTAAHATTRGSSSDQQQQNRQQQQQQQRQQRPFPYISVNKLNVMDHMGVEAGVYVPRNLQWVLDDVCIRQFWFPAMEAPNSRNGRICIDKLKHRFHNNQEPAEEEHDDGDVDAQSQRQQQQLTSQSASISRVVAQTTTRNAIGSTTDNTSIEFPGGVDRVATQPQVRSGGDQTTNDEGRSSVDQGEGVTTQPIDEADRGSAVALSDNTGADAAPHLNRKRRIAAVTATTTAFVENITKHTGGSADHNKKQKSAVVEHQTIPIGDLEALLMSNDYSQLDELMKLADAAWENRPTNHAQHANSGREHAPSPAARTANQGVPNVASGSDSATTTSVVPVGDMKELLANQDELQEIMKIADAAWEARCHEQQNRSTIQTSLP